MISNKLLLLSALLAAMAIGGCGGGGSHSSKPATIANATFQVVWPARSRGALTTGLTSALSCQVVFKAAQTNGQDLTLKFDRDSTQVAGYTATYQLGQTILASTSSLNATFYAQPAEAGPVVGTASAALSFTGSAANLAKIVVQGVIRSVSVLDAGALPAGSKAVQMRFTTADDGGNAVAVTPGSAIWAVVSGSTYLTITKDGIATPVSPGPAVVTATVDGITSPNSTITVTSSGGKGTYRLVVIPTSSSNIFNCAINSSGEVVANTISNNGGDLAYSWTQAVDSVQVLNLGSSFSGSLGTAINDSGQIVGQVFTGTGAAAVSQPAVWSSNSPSPVEPPQTIGSGSSTAGVTSLWGLNNSGAFVGGTDPSFANNTTANYWATSTSAPATLSQGGAVGAIAFAINSSGEIAGAVQSQSSQTTGTHACVWTSYSATPTLLKEVSGGTTSEAVALNTSGEILGSETESDGKQHILIWSSATAAPTDIASQPVAQVAAMSPNLMGSLNDSGVAVWLSLSNGFGGDIYTPAGGVQDLTSLLDSSGTGYTVTSACAINSSGWIAGSARVGGIIQPVLLVPN